MASTHAQCLGVFPLNEPLKAGALASKMSAVPVAGVHRPNARLLLPRTLLPGRVLRKAHSQPNSSNDTPRRGNGNSSSAWPSLTGTIAGASAILASSEAA